jgi:putative endonuclease
VKAYPASIEVRRVSSGTLPEAAASAAAQGLSGQPSPFMTKKGILATTRRGGERRLNEILALCRHPTVMPQRRRRGQTAYANGLAAEDAACAALIGDGWTIHARRVRTAAGEVDAIAEKNGILSIVEVKSRPTLADAAIALTVRQQTRLLGACEIILAQHPEWGVNGVRFDVVMVNPAGQVRRIADAFRLGDLGEGSDINWRSAWPC